MYLEPAIGIDLFPDTHCFNLLWRSNVFGTSELFISLFIEFVSISFGDLMYLEHAIELILTDRTIVSISFGDLMYLERAISDSVTSDDSSFNLLWRSNVFGTDMILTDVAT